MLSRVWVPSQWSQGLQCVVFATSRAESDLFLASRLSPFRPQALGWPQCFLLNHQTLDEVFGLCSSERQALHLLWTPLLFCSNLFYVLQKSQELERRAQSWADILSLKAWSPSYNLPCLFKIWTLSTIRAYSWVTKPMTMVYISYWWRSISCSTPIDPRSDGPD